MSYPSRAVPIVCVIAVALTAIGCEEGVGAPDLPGHTAMSDEVHREVAQGFALAMRNSDLRLALRDAFRYSPWTQHKLLTHQLTQTEAGARLISMAAREMGVSADQFEAAIMSLPPMDFYVPIRSQRTSWDGHSRYIVAASLTTDDDSVEGYYPDGSVVRVEGRTDPTLAEWTLFLLHPAEEKGRLASKPDPEGQTIQDSWYEPYYAQVVVRRPGRLPVDHWRLVDRSQPAPGMPQDLARDGTQNTYMPYVNIKVGDGFGDCEVLWRVEFTDGSQIRSNDVHEPDFPCPDDDNFDPGKLVIDYAPLYEGEEIEITFIEQDEFDDDHYGTLNWDPGDEHQTMSNSNWSAQIEWSSGDTGGGGPGCFPECQTYLGGGSE